MNKEDLQRRHGGTWRKRSEKREARSEKNATAESTEKKEKLDRKGRNRNAKTAGRTCIEL
jgi:hypothetical protein